LLCQLPHPSIRNSQGCLSGSEFPRTNCLRASVLNWRNIAVSLTMRGSACHRAVCRLLGSYPRTRFPRDHVEVAKRAPQAPSREVFVDLLLEIKVGGAWFRAPQSTSLDRFQERQQVVVCMESSEWCIHRLDLFKCLFLDREICMHVGVGCFYAFVAQPERDDSNIHTRLE